MNEFDRKIRQIEQCPVGGGGGVRGGGSMVVGTTLLWRRLDRSSKR